MSQAGVPEYRRIRDALRSQLELGELQPGDKFSSERELVERFGVAHMTVRHAIDGLVREGLLARRRGSGTYVAQVRSVSRSINRLQSFSEDVGAGSAGAKVLVQRETDPPEDVRDHLDLLNRGRVVELVRLRCIDGEPVAINEAWLPVRTCPDLVNENMEDASLYAYLERIGVALSRAEQRISAVAADAERANLLHVDVGSPLLYSERTSRDAGNLPVEFARTWSRPDIAVLVEMKR